MADLMSEMERLTDLYKQDGNVAHLEEMFHLIDKDNSGEITKQEAADLFRPRLGGEADSVAAQFIADADKNGDQKVNLAEFIALLSK